MTPCMLAIYFVWVWISKKAGIFWLCSSGLVGVGFGSFKHTCNHEGCCLTDSTEGGLLPGIALAAKAFKPSIKIIAAEPLGANDAARTKVTGHIIPMLHPSTIAYGLRASLGDLTW
jgi:hypothetical protein